MMRSLFAGVSGLKNHQTRMDVIGNNIANVNTIGFKSGRVSFQDVLSQTLQGASAGSGGRGGTNPVQVGLGVGLASIDTLFTDGSFQPTGKQTDLAIQGAGFFILSDGLNQVYTRAGAFDFDRLGNFVVPGTGYQVMGWLADINGNIDTNAAPTRITIPVGQTMPAQATTKVTYAYNLSAEAEVNTQVPVSIVVYDSQGNAYKLKGIFEKTGDNEWSFGNIEVIDPKGVTHPVAGATTIRFTAAGSFDSADPLTIAFADTISGQPLQITPDFSRLTQYGGESSVQAVDADGYAAGVLEQTTIDTSGVIMGYFSNGQSQPLARIALATFNNPGGLIKVGENLFAVSSNSGEPLIGTSGTGGRGTLSSGTLEMSNVDLAQEFTNMIITQRGFQANSKIITVTDEMLQELANLKR